MAKPIRKEKHITVIGANFLDFVVWDLVHQSCLTYRKTDFSKKRFQTSISEHSYAAAAIVLSVLGIEAYRNRLYCLQKCEITGSVSNDICKMITKENNEFPHSKLKVLLEEVFVLRDIIVHNHVYEVTVTYQNYDILGHRQRLLQGRTDSKKYLRCVNKKARKTNLLKLNVQPTKITFEDIFKVLVVVDLLIRVMQHGLPTGYIPFHVSRQIGDYHLNNLSEIITYYYGQIKRKSFLVFLEGLAAQLRNDFAPFLPKYPHSHCFIFNICPQCSKLGWDRVDNKHYCSKCGLRMGIVENGVLRIGYADEDIETV